MNKQLELELANMKNMTMELIHSLKNNEFDKLEALFDKRQTIIDKIDTLDYTKQEFAVICKEIELERLELDLERMLNDKRTEVRRNIDRLSEQKQASRSYGNQFSVDSIYFNKKL